MNKEQIIQWAREAGFMPVTKSDPETGCWYECFDDELEALAKLVAAHEREQCAMVCETHAPTTTPTWVSYAAAIRARSST
jgi:hypothetical protein